MEAPQLYRESIIALRDSNWEQATRTLLAIVTEKPDFRDAATVLSSLEKKHPIAYWSAVFATAADRGDWPSAQEAVSTLEAIAPALPQLSSMRESLQVDREAPTPENEPAQEPTTRDDDIVEESQDLSIFEVDLSDSTTRPSTVQTMLDAKTISPNERVRPSIHFESAGFNEVTQPIVTITAVEPVTATVPDHKGVKSKAERNIRIFLIVLVLIWVILIVGAYALVALQADIADSIGFILYWPLLAS